MNSKYVILASTLLISAVTFAQKDQIKAAEKSLKNGNAQEAITTLQSAESLIGTADDSQKAQYYFVQGNAYLSLADKKVEESKNLSLAGNSFKEVKDIEKASGNDKYSTQAKTSIVTIKNRLINSAIDDSKVNKFDTSAAKLYDAYLLDKKDTLNLYYAASSYVNAKDNANALKLYGKLKDLNYSGKATNYLAVSKISGQDDLFNNKKERDNAVKIGTHEKPKTEEIPSKRGEIYRNIAIILVQEGKTEEAKKAISDARKANPDDDSLILTEADLYLKTKDYDTYKKLITEVLEKKPNDANLLFNLGVISSDAKNNVEAEKYYQKAISIDPNFTNAYVNMAGLKLQDEQVIIDEMNKLSTSANDMKRYDVLKAKRDKLFKDSIPYLEKAHELSPTDIGVAKTLLGVYSALEMPEAKPLKAKIKELEAAK